MSTTSPRVSRFLRVVGVVLAAGAGCYAVAWFAPRLAEAGESLGHMNWGWFAAACWAELVALVYLARLQRMALRVGGVDVSLRTSLGLTVSANAMNATLPGGTVISSVYSFKRMRLWGASRSLVGFTLSMTMLFSVTTFVAITFAGFALTGGDTNLPVAIVAGVGGVAAVLGLRVLLRDADRMMRIGSAVLAQFNRVLRKPQNRGVNRLRLLVADLTGIRPRQRDWWAFTGCASVNWLAEIGCLFLCCRAVGLEVGFADVIIVFAAGVGASNLPLIPGGLGIIDAALLLALIQCNCPSTAATAAVLLYRLISLVLVVSVGWLTVAAQRGQQLDRPDDRMPANDVDGPASTAGTDCGKDGVASSGPTRGAVSGSVLVGAAA